MEAPWLLLDRVIFGGPGPNPNPPGLDAEDEQDVEAVGAQEEQAGATYADELEQAQKRVAAVSAEIDFFFYPQAQPPPRILKVVAMIGAHPDADRPDLYPYIIAAGPFGILAHFAVAPNHGTSFDANPQNTRLVLVRNFGTGELITPTAEQLPDRTGLVPGLGNVASVGVLFDDAHDTIAELQVGHGGHHATLVRFRVGEGHWSRRDMVCPLPQVGREWAPHGAVSITSFICWYDLSWGMLSCDFDQPEAELALNFHHLPDGRALVGAAPVDIHTTRCITVTQERTPRLRYVEIIPNPHGGEAPTLAMWTRFIGRDGWGWVQTYAVSFERIWNDAGYIKIGLPRNVVPVLAVVSPSNHQLVYFALEHYLFGVNMPHHRFEHGRSNKLVPMPGPPRPASGRYIAACRLSPAVAQALGFDANAGWPDGNESEPYSG